MKYDLDTIPAKLFFRIASTGDVSLLGKNSEMAWKKMEEEHIERFSPTETNRALDLYGKIEALNAKYRTVNLAVHYLKSIRDWDLIEMLKGLGYTFSFEKVDDYQKGLEQYRKDIDRIESQSESIATKITLAQNQLPKQKRDKGDFDHMVMSYAAFTGSGFIDTNKITIPQYYSLIKMGNEKIKSLEKNGKGKNN